MDATPPTAEPLLPDRRSALAMACLLALLATGDRPGLAAPESKGLKGKAVELKSVPRTQLAVAARPKPLGDAVRVGDATFAVKRIGTATLMAPSPRAAPSAAVGPGTPMTLSWKQGSETRKLRIAFAQAPDGGLAYFAATAWRYSVAGTTVTLLDGDADGRYDSRASDAWGMGEEGFALPYAPSAVVGRSRVFFETIAPDGSALTVRIEPLAGSESQLAALDTLNAVRLAHGMPACGLDEEKSRACTLHAQYLAMNGWTGYTNPHDEDPKAPGFTPEGQAVAPISVIIKAAPAVALDSFWRSYYHRVPLVVPALERIGIAAQPPGICVMDPSAGPRANAPPTSPWGDPICSPADGSVGVPVAFNPAGERPDEPVPDSGRRGMPLMLIFASYEPGVSAFSAVLEEMHGARAEAVPVHVADPRGLTNVLGCVPDAPLSAASAYRATFAFTRDQRPQVVVVHFRTQ